MGASKKCIWWVHLKSASGGCIWRMRLRTSVFLMEKFSCPNSLYIIPEIVSVFIYTQFCSFGQIEFSKYLLNSSIKKWTENRDWVEKRHNSPSLGLRKTSENQYSCIASASRCLQFRIISFSIIICYFIWIMLFYGLWFLTKYITNKTYFLTFGIRANRIFI
jgi:hypothetical protein